MLHVYFCLGLNSVMKSLPLKPEEAILLYTWQYEAIANTCEMASKKSGNQPSFHSYIFLGISQILDDVM